MRSWNLKSERPRLLVQSFAVLVRSSCSLFSVLGLDFQSLEEALQEKFTGGIKEKIDKDKNDLECSKEQKDFLRTFVVAPLIPDLKDRYTELLAEDEYPEEGHSFVGKSQDEWLPLIRGWLKNPVQRPEGLTDKQYLLFTRFVKGFFVDKENRLYRRSIDSHHKLVVDKSHRMYMM